ncbi:hypothetical protein B0H19DRAFT_159736 [Mycena capillaripes]|nr:hypothetical protein B0H19DRAFT_159736 [Mycena capillaripes]
MRRPSLLCVSICCYPWRAAQCPALVRVLRQARTLAGSPLPVHRFLETCLALCVSYPMRCLALVELGSRPGRLGALWRRIYTGMDRERNVIDGRKTRYPVVFRAAVRFRCSTEPSPREGRDALDSRRRSHPRRQGSRDGEEEEKRMMEGSRGYRSTVLNFGLGLCVCSRYRGGRRAFASSWYQARPQPFSLASAAGPPPPCTFSPDIDESGACLLDGRLLGISSPFLIYARLLPPTLLRTLATVWVS